MSIEELDQHVKSFMSKITTTGQLIDHLKDVQSSYEQVLATFDTINNDKKNVNLIAEAIKGNIEVLVNDIQKLHHDHLQTLSALKEAILQSQQVHTKDLQDLLINFKTSHEQALTNLDQISHSIQDFIKEQQHEIKTVFKEVLDTLTATKTELADVKEETKKVQVNLLTLQEEISAIKTESAKQFNELKTQQGLILDKIAALHHRIDNPPKKKFLGIF